MKILETKGDEPLKIKGFDSYHVFDIQEDGKIKRVWVHIKKPWWWRNFWWIALLVFAAITVYKIWVGDFGF